MTNTVALELAKTFNSLLEFMNRNKGVLSNKEVEILGRDIFKLLTLQYYAKEAVLPKNFNVDNKEIMNNVKQKIELKNEIDSMRATIDLIEKNKPNKLINNITNKSHKYSQKLADFEADIKADETGVIVKNINNLKQQEFNRIISKLRNRN